MLPASAAATKPSGRRQRTRNVGASEMHPVWHVSMDRQGVGEVIVAGSSSSDDRSISNDLQLRTSQVSTSYVLGPSGPTGRHAFASGQHKSCTHQRSPCARARSSIQTSASPFHSPQPSKHAASPSVQGTELVPNGPLPCQGLCPWRSHVS